MRTIKRDSTVLVTGGCGSIGSEIVRQLVKKKPKQVRVYDNREGALVELGSSLGNSTLRYFIGDVRDRERLDLAMEQVDLVFHAAALKHVPVCEYNPFEAVQTNVLGTQNVMESASYHNVKRVVNISTDKAVSPNNVLGATKLLAEKITERAGFRKAPTLFANVRFGNVMWSDGSVFPLFADYIKDGKKLNVTSLDMERYYMTIKDAVGLVFKAMDDMDGGETFILKMPSFKMGDPINDEHTTTEVFNIPYGSNWIIEDWQREIVKAAYKDRPDLYDRYVRGRFSFVQLGEAVTPEYNEKIHRARTTIPPNPGFETFRFWDGGLNPTCVIMQMTPRGRMLFLDTIRGENIGVKQLIQTQVVPLMNTKYKGIEDWRDIGDPSMANREQSDSSQNAADVINTELNAAFERGEKAWDNRREAMKEMFNRMVDGEPMFMLSRNDVILHRCLRGGWHYGRDNSGNIIRDKPRKDLHSHPGDAVSHGVAKIILRPKMMDRMRRIKNAVSKRTVSNV